MRTGCFNRRLTWWLAFAVIVARASAQTITWSGTGDWSTPANWSSNPNLPTSQSSVQLPSGTLTVSDTRAVAALTLSGGTLNGAGTLNVGGLLTWSGTTLAGTGTLVANGGANLTTNVSLHAGQTLTLAGNSTWSAGTVYTGTGAILNNTGALTTTANADFYAYYGGTKLTFNNSGSFTKNTATADTALDAIVNNTGTITVNSGSVSVGGGGTNTGTINVASGATFALTGGNFTFANGSLVNGAGTVLVSGGTTTFSGANTGSASIALSGSGTATFNGNTTTTGGGTFSAGTLNGTGNLTFGAPLTISGGDLKGTGTLTANAGANLTANFSLHEGQTLTLAGNSTWSAGTVYTGTGAILNNTGALTTTANADFYAYYGGTKLTFNNSGSFTKNTATADTALDAIVNNTGTITVNSGSVSVGGGGTNTGTINVASGATFALTGGNFTFASGSLVNGAGTVLVSGGTTTWAGANTGSASISLSGSGTATFSGNTTTTGGGTFSAGTLNGTGNLTLGAPLTISGGDLKGTGTLTANAGANITANFSLHDGQTLSLAGNSTWSAGTVYTGTGAILNNTGALTTTANADFYAYYGGTKLTFNNSGSFTKNTATADTALDAIVNNTGTITVNSGSVSVGGGGTNTGTINVAAGATFALTGGNFTFTNGSLVNGAGTVLVSGGTTTFSGANTGSASISLAGSGTATFNGNTTTTGGGTFTAGTLNGTGNLTLGAPLTISGGDLKGTGTLTANAGANLTANFSLHDGQTLSLAGNSTWSAGTLYVGTGAILNNTGALTTTANADFYAYYGGTKLTFNNSGSFTKSTATADTALDATVNNTGTISVNSGSVSVGGGGTNTGTINVAAGATFALTGGNFTFANGSLVNGDGTVRVSGGTTTFSGANTGSASIALSGSGTATFSGNTTTTGGGTISAGTLNGTGNLTFGAPLTISGGDLKGTGTLTANAGANVTANFSLHDGQTLSLAGNSTWSAGTVYTGTGAILNNTGALTTTANADFYAYYGGTKLTFNNSGTFTKTTATGDTTLDAIVNNTGTISVNTGSVSLAAGGTNSASAVVSTATGATLRFTGGTFALDQGASLTGAGSYELAGGTLAIAAGTASLSNLTGTHGTLAGAGNATIGVLTQTGGSLAISDFTLTGPGSTWSSGNWSSATPSTATIARGATLAIATGNSHDLDYRAVTNLGTVNWNVGYFRGGHGATFTNAAGATFNDQVTSGYSFHNPFGGTFRFVNQGTYTRNAAGHTSYFDVPFDNTGTVAVSAGDLQLRAGGTMSSSGTMAAAAGTNLIFTAGYTVANGASLTGPGTFTLSGGTFDVTGTMNVSTFNQTGGTLAGINSLAGLMNWSGGDWSAASAGTSTTLLAGTTLNLNTGSSKDFARRAVLNQGTVNWNSGYIRSGHEGSFTNALGATFNDFNPSGYTVHNPFGGTFVFTNQGTYNRNAANTTSYFDVPFDNTGTVNVLAGDLQFRGGGTMTTSGTIAAAAGTDVYFTSGYTINNGASLTGAGTYWLTGGTLTLTGTVAVGTFNQTGGTLAGTSTLNGLVNWSGGTWSATAAGPSTTIASTATLNLTTGSNKDLDYRAIINRGIVNWSSGYIRGGHGATFTNAAGATFNDQNTSGYTIHNPFGDSFVFTNQGTYHRAVTGTTYFDTTFNNTGTINLTQGDLQIRQGGTMGATSVVNAAADTHVYFTSHYTLVDGAVFTGAGNFVQTGGTLTVDGALKAPAFHWQSGNWNATAAATTTIDKATTLHLTTGGNKDFDFRSITNLGTVNWVQGYLRAGHGSVFTNAVGATFNDQNASGYTVHNPFGGTFTFVNEGTYTRAVAGTTSFDAPFNNTGTINLAQGDIQLRAGGTMSATSVVNAATGTNFLFADDYTLITGSRLIGPGNFTQTGGTLTVDGTLKASSFNWSSGNWNTSATATTTLDPTTVLNLVSGGNKDFNARTIVNQGTVNWHQGYLRSGNGGSFVNAPGATFNDQNSSSYSVQAAYSGAGGFAFVNQGTYVRNVAGTTFFDTTFNNSGTVTLSQGDIQIRQGGTMAATSIVNAATGTNLYLTNDYTVLAGSQFTGAGTVHHTAGTLTVETLKASSFNWTGGNWNGAGTSLLDATTVVQIASGHDHDFDARTIRNFGTVNWSAGRLRSGHGGSFTNAGILNDSSGYSVNNDYTGPTATFANAATGTYNKTAGSSTYYVPFTNAGTINVTNGALNLSGGGSFSGGAIVTTGGDGVQLTGGTFSATAAATGTLSWHGADFNGTGTSTFGPSLTVNINTGHDHDFDARTLLTQGIVNWSSGRLRSGNGGSVTNTGTWNDSSGYSVNNDYAGTTATFTNATGGTYTKTSGTSTYYLPFTNAGTINVTGGAINLSAGGALAGGTMLLTGGSGVQLTGGTFTAAAAASGTVAWQGANFNGTGTSTFGPGLTVNLNTGHDHDFDARTLLTQGIVNWSAGRLRSGHGGAIVNTGTWNDSSGYSFNNDYTGPTATFTNATGGTYTKTAGFSTFHIPFTNAGTLRAEGGTLRFDNTFTNSGGTLVAAGGNFSFAQALDLGTGRLGGTGTITAPSVTAGGQVSPGNSPGQLTLTGNLSLLASSTLVIELAGTAKGTSYDFLSVGGSAVLAGQLSVTILNGFQSTLASTDTFTVVTATNLSGAFTNVVNGARLYTSDGFGSFQVNYGPASTYALNSVVLTQFAPIPEPSTYALMGLGLIIVLAAARRRRNS